MSERLTPEQQREMRVRMGGEVQGLSESVSGSLPRDPDKMPLLEQMKLVRARRVADEIISGIFGSQIEVTRETRLEAAIVEACEWLRQGAPGCALQTLENALKL